MSFFDDEGDEPPTRAARPRRPAQPRPATARSRASAAPADAQQLMLRRALAIGAGVLVLILLVVGVNGCLDSRTKNSLKNYNRDVNTIAADSTDQVSKRLFELLDSDSGSSIALVQNVNQLRVTAEDQLRRAESLSVPDDMTDAQRHLLVALSLRAEGVEKIADDLPDINGSQKRAAAERIAGSMREFLASDVLFSQRVVPYIGEALVDNGIGGQTTVRSQFLPNDTWLSASTVGDRLGVAGAGGSSGSGSCPNTCGHGLTSVAIGGTTLQPDVNNRVTISAEPAFAVTFQNQGQSDAFDVTVRVTISAAGTKTISAPKTVEETKAGKSTTTTVRVTQMPELNRALHVKVEVRPVSGEKTTSNNSQTFTVTFAR